MQNINTFRDLNIQEHKEQIEEAKLNTRVINQSLKNTRCSCLWNPFLTKDTSNRVYEAVIFFWFFFFWGGGWGRRWGPTKIISIFKDKNLCCALPIYQYPAKLLKNRKLNNLTIILTITFTI